MDAVDDDLRLDIFERQRPVLLSLAYRMLGERAAAEDIVQEAWLCWAGTERVHIEVPEAWLRQVTTRLAIDELRSARARREVYVGPWLPEPIEAEDAQASGFERAQDCELALLWAMERLTPEERAAFILREAFDADYAEIAKSLGKTEAACRQLVSRAKRALHRAGPRFDAPPEEVRDLLRRFAQAAVSQDRAQVMALLAPDALAMSDGGGFVRAALRPLMGAADVAQVMMAISSRSMASDAARAVTLNGRPGLAILAGSERDMVFTLAPDADGRIAWIYIMRNPAKLPRGKSALG